MGCGPSHAVTNFDYPINGPEFGNIKTKYISRSFLYCLAQHVSEWPEYYALIDCRSRSQFDSCHINGADPVSLVEPVQDRLNELTVILYGPKPDSPVIHNFLREMSGNGVEPSQVYILDCPFSKFKARYRVVLSTSVRTSTEQPGPIELLACTKQNPAVYCIHRNQFQHCKTTVAMLGCSTVINISSRRLFLKTTAITLENIQFDSANEPYDEAIAVFMKHVNKRPTSNLHGNILLIDETGWDYGTLLVGWYWYKQGHPLEKVCELLATKYGELDPWYTEVLRAWTQEPDV